MLPAHLMDTNILVRVAKRDDPQHALVVAATDRLIGDGADVCYVPQNIVELWNVLTRPKEQNGSGLSVVEADREAALLEKQFTFLPDSKRVHTEWRRLVMSHSVSGKQVHDARLVAAMVVHGVYPPADAEHKRLRPVPGHHRRASAKFGGSGVSQLSSSAPQPDWHGLNGV